MKLLVFNTGSSTLKISIFEGNNDSDAPFPSEFEFLEKFEEPSQAAVARAFEKLWPRIASSIGDLGSVVAVGHRIVHGGDIRESCRIDTSVRRVIERHASFAPLHNPLALGVLDLATNALDAKTPHIAVFDTSFHTTLPRVATTYPGPAEWIDHGYRRYGFHGINHRYVTRRAAELLNQPLNKLRLVSCHLGNGCSLAAVQNGTCIDTTMGFTPLEGLMMGTRSGTIDPGLILYLIQSGTYSADALDHLLNRSSGLKGISGVSGDFREVSRAADRNNERAQFALDLFLHRLKREFGGMAANLSGLDAVVFTGGIGEGASGLREQFGTTLPLFQMEIDKIQNQAAGDRIISTPGSKVAVVVVAAQEDREIARECLSVIRKR